MKIDPRLIESLNKLSAPSESMLRAAESMTRVRVALQESLNKSNIDYSQVSKPAEEFAKRIEAIFNQIDIPSVRNTWLSNQDNVQRVFDPLIKSIKSLEGYPEKLQMSIMLLAEYGWYIDKGTSIAFLNEVTEMLEENKIEEVDEILCDYYSEKLEVIEKNVLLKLNKRCTILKAVFEAHRKEMYELTVPVLLTQIDGICKDHTDSYFFMKDNYKPRTSKYVETIEEEHMHLTIQAIYLTPLKSNYSINISEKDRGENFDKLNRHMILHGEDTLYGSKVNSVKMISFLNYVTDMFYS